MLTVVSNSGRRLIRFLCDGTACDDAESLAYLREVVRAVSTSDDIHHIIHTLIVLSSHICTLRLVLILNFASHFMCRFRYVQ